MWWTSLTGWERCCPAPSFPQGIPGASLLAQKFPGAPADPQPNRQGPSTRIARRKAWYTSCDLASCQGPRDCDLFYMFFFAFFSWESMFDEVAEVAWDWPTCRFGSCGVHIRLIPIVLTLLILFWLDPNCELIICCPMSRGLASSNP